ncbi:MAG: YggS family pyridoxal phosphate-dependent enzyme [Pseudomonadales bacterium]|nr:YggS family pyridoxal phosphate-dependent enzyme [Pseudomonadales bacterium]MBL6807490.1 YggS family pyridoxal phosphate-dependent enzyme [Pseudomonadales bacterium]MDA0954911.1 YggS family pyridoxal phosphate-dependent enzyme [Pseudomonadota bacterium]
MTALQARVRGVHQRLATAAAQAGRDPKDLTLIAVSKTQPAEAVATLAALGQRDFGENYLQEALDKQAALSALALQWHFIGALQSNKTRPVSEHFSWVHTIDRAKLAERLSAQRPKALGPLAVCVQVKLDPEPGKAGVAPDALAPLLDTIERLPGLRLAGLMTLPAPREGFEAQRASLARLTALAKALPETARVLSMGMSDDLEAAVAAGATHLRLGTALFGPRQPAGASP